MKYYLSIIALLSVLVFSQCKEKNTLENNPQTTQFGEKFSIENVMSMNDVLAVLETQDSVTMQMKATVGNVCQVKGCWMNLSTDGSDQEIFVKFKDYAFFMPLDLAGNEVIVEGMAYSELTPVEELRHYAEDAGKSEEEIAAITEPEKEFKIMASGVKIVQ